MRALCVPLTVLQKLQYRNGYCTVPYQWYSINRHQKGTRSALYRSKGTVERFGTVSRRAADTPAGHHGGGNESTTAVTKQERKAMADGTGDSVSALIGDWDCPGVMTAHANRTQHGSFRSKRVGLEDWGCPFAMTVALFNLANGGRCTRVAQCVWKRG